jgi:hypothetical protein
MANLKTLNLPWKTFSGLSEAKKIPAPEGKRKYRVCILTEGRGNPKDKHLYPIELIRDPSTAQAFNGKPCFLNHSDAIEESTRPERRIEDIGGYFSNCQNEGSGIMADLILTTTQAGDFLEAFIQDCLNYSQEFPGENLGGISINAAGDTKPEEIEGETWKRVTKIKEAISADAVTLPARGGEFLKQLESAVESNGSVKEILMAMRDRIESGDVDQKVLRRMVDNAITASEGHNPETTGGEAMQTEAKSKASEIGEDEAKALHGYWKGKASEAKGEADRAMFSANAEKYAKMAGVGDELPAGEPDGDEPVKKESEEEDEAKKKESEEEAKKKEGEASEKKQAESLRTENAEMKTQLLESKIKESGLPDAWHKSIRLMCAGKTLKEADAVIESEVLKYESTLQESGRQPAKPGSVGGDKKTDVAATFAKHGLI